MIRQKVKLTKKQRSVLNFIRTELNAIRSYKTFDEYCDAVIHVKRKDDPAFYNSVRAANEYRYDLAMQGKYEFLLFPRDVVTLNALHRKALINIYVDEGEEKGCVLVALKEEE